ncbi:MAG: hypothetical protein AABZ06_09425 [Bdellovibrionota bacterium]
MHLIKDKLKMVKKAIKKGGNKPAKKEAKKSHKPPADDIRRMTLKHAVNHAEAKKDSAKKPQIKAKQPFVPKPPAKAHENSAKHGKSPAHVVHTKHVAHEKHADHAKPAVGAKTRKPRGASINPGNLGNLRRASGAVKASKQAALAADIAETVCREVACEGLATTAGYCRLHYIKNWKKIKRKELILKEKKLNQYIEELVSKYPDKYIDAIRQDLTNDKDFAKVIHDLDLDASMDDFDMEGEPADSIIDNIKRDFDDDGDGF